MEDPTKAYFHRPGTVATWWYPESQTYPLYRHFLEQLRWAVAQCDWRGKRVLDIGTGRGRFAISYALNGGQVWGMDISQEMLELAEGQAREAGAEVRWLLGDAETLPFGDRTFDVVSCMETVMHVPHPERLLQEVRRVARPGAPVLLSFTNRWRLNALLRQPIRLYRRLGLWEAAPEAQILWTYTRGELQRLVEGAGLRLERVVPQGLLQANARFPLPGGYSLPLFPRRLADWCLLRVEPALRHTALGQFMGTYNVLARA